MRSYSTLPTLLSLVLFTTAAVPGSVLGAYGNSAPNDGITELAELKSPLLSRLSDQWAVAEGRMHWFRVADCADLESCE